MGDGDYSVTSSDGTTMTSGYESQERTEDKVRSPVGRAWLSCCPLFRGSYVLPDPLEQQSRDEKSGRS